jgi:hypothetical protein
VEREINNNGESLKHHLLYLNYGSVADIRDFDTEPIDAAAPGLSPVARGQQE